MDTKLKQLLISLADRYEVSSFYDEDPSQFLNRYKNIAECELAGFIAAMLAFGSRKQFIPKINFIFCTADSSAGGIFEWIKSAAYKKDFPAGKDKFYRFYSYDDMQIFFDELSKILNEEICVGEYFRKKYEQALQNNSIKTESEKKSISTNIHLSEIISQSFPESKIVPKGKNSANKRIHMFLRWMVRQNSPVDKGFWNWYPEKNLLIPLDVHVMQMAQKLKLIPSNSKPDKKTAQALTNILKEAFPEDPARGDFALFGAGAAQIEPDTTEDL